MVNGDCYILENSEPNPGDVKTIGTLEDPLSGKELLSVYETGIVLY